ncbi:DUF3883 domain-containing protein [Solirubrobacter phytolaccae]|uniref:DUF3883 domain-containing protein n=1 Tax=Solirubrobacter phytolaccae TaxID=1404360 RepID=A0A9X3N975_9ACTN|nr:DUF3883 domain-containing protein [Solirubrobacter phytolaccae]MDA0179936.1 DUF3883 domain-containing protein [Solirubrobacter phytolaccae]
MSAWEPPELQPSELEYRVGSSFVEEFAAGHSAVDVLRELVQNEYDAQGRALTVTFGADGLAISGTGRVIDNAGWRRLSVMLGTGTIAGEEEKVPQKINGIGSKNFGLRSLFIFGDQIYIRSGGRQTVLDHRRGAWPSPRTDPSSRGVPGAHVFVPWRIAQVGKLEAYSPEREERDIVALASELAPTVMKLAAPSGPRSLRAVTVASARLERTLQWEQRVRMLGRHRAGGVTLERSITRSDSSAERNERIVELEYQRTVEIPPRHRTHAFPTYFRVPGQRIRIGVSLRMRRKRPDMTHAGHLFHPIGAVNALTGCALSVSAPFEMNSDRKDVIDPGHNEWNAWLLEITADFVLQLVTTKWLDEFGADAYLALPRQTDHGDFAAQVIQRLQTRECWATRERAGGRRPAFRAASHVMIGITPELDELVGDVRRLDPRLWEPSVIAMARDAGARSFTVASAVRLRCAGKDATRLSTKLGDAVGDLHYPTFPAPWRNLELQRRFAEALGRHPLSANQRNDLRTSPTTLTAAGTLASPSDPLWLIDPALAAVSPVAPGQQLHAELHKYRALARLCEPFETSRWARGVAERALTGDADDDEREALYHQMLSAPETIGRTTWPVVKRSPVVRDHRGEWAAPNDLVLSRVGRRIEPALRFPGDAVAGNTRLMKRLAIRSKLTGADLVAYANVVVERPDLAPGFEQLLMRHRPLLTRLTVKRLESIAFLLSSNGQLIPPAKALIRTPYLLKCVGPNAAFVEGTHPALYDRLGCSSEPRSDDILRHLEELREAGSGPSHPNVLYPALVASLRVEKAIESLVDEPVIFEGGDWHTPARVLLGRRNRFIFGPVLPVIQGGLERVYQALGADVTAQQRHWRRFLEWLDQQSESGRRQLPGAQRAVIRAAYVQLGRVPDSLPPTWHVLLDTEGRLHPTTDAPGRRLLIDDDPATARVVREQGLPIAFADLVDPVTRRFYESAGTIPLTIARRSLGFTVGQDRPGPPGFIESTTLARLQQRAFSSAVYAVAAADRSQSLAPSRTFSRRLRHLTGVSFVTSLMERYRLGRHELQVSRDVAVIDRRIVLSFMRSKSEVNGAIARAVASLVDDATATQRPLADAIFRILSCDSTDEVQRYLAERGVSWNPDAGDTSFDDLIAEEESATDNLVAQVGEALQKQLGQIKDGLPATGPVPPPKPSPNPPKPGPPRPLPALDEVKLSTAPPAAWTPPVRNVGHGGGGGGNGRLRTPAEEARDREVGRRGEELVLEDERKRVQGLGFLPERVIWTAAHNPAANHDIRSVDADGADIWLEVKATTGRHGRFDWPLAEFELALRARDRYVLCRVYEADSKSPVLVREPDPIAKLSNGSMRLDISGLSAEIAPLG